MAKHDHHPSGFPAHLIAFVTTVNGAISITMGTLSLYSRPVADEDDFPREKADVQQMRSLCHDLGRNDSGLEQLTRLLDLQDEFIAQGRQVSPEQAANAEALAREYIDWVFATFPEKMTRAS